MFDEGKWAEAAAYCEGIGVQVAANGTAKREPFRVICLAIANLHLGKYREAEFEASQVLAFGNNRFEKVWKKNETEVFRSRHD